MVKGKTLHNLLIFSLFFIFSFCAAAQNTTLIKSSIRFENTTSTKIGLYYFDQFNDFTNLDLSPKEIKKINSDQPLMVYSISNINEIFWVYPNDILKISIDKDGRFLMKAQNELRTREVNFLKNVAFYANPIKSKTEEMNKDAKLLANPLKRDSVLTKRYEAELDFLKEYATTYQIPSSFNDSVKTYFFYQLLKEQSDHLLTRSFVENKLPTFYKEKLLDLKQYLNCDACLDITSYRQFALNYLVFIQNTKNDNLLLPYFSDIFKGATRDFLLFYVLKSKFNLNKPVSENDFKLFMTECKNEEYKGYIANLYNYSIIKKDFSKKELLNTVGIRSSFSDLVKKYPNKVIYIDFWASWCGPCIEEMPASLALANKYKGKNIVFVYFSLDKNKNAWETGIKANQLNPTNNYLIVNDFEASLPKQFKIKEIPRYFIVNKSGKIISADAPRPSELKLIDLLNKALN